jgi:hypothetical protein
VTPTPGGAAPLHEQTVTGGSTSSTTVTSASLAAGTSGSLYLAAISSKPSVAVTSVSGLGLTWTLVRAQCSGRNQTRIEVWVAQGAGSAGSVTATLASAPGNTVIIVSRFSGASGVGNVVSANTVGVSGACSGGVDSGTYSVNLTTAVDNALAYGAAGMRNRTHTPGSGYTERADLIQGSGGDTAGAASEDRVVPTAGTIAVDGTFSSATDWAMVGLEIRP